jgi:hypothetical protein
VRLHQAFKRERIAGIEDDRWQMTEHEVRDWADLLDKEKVHGGASETIEGP